MNGNKTGVRLYVIDDYYTAIVTDFVQVLVHPQPEGAAESKLNNINEVSVSTVNSVAKEILKKTPPNDNLMLNLIFYEIIF